MSKASDLHRACTIAETHHLHQPAPLLHRPAPACTIAAVQVPAPPAPPPIVGGEGAGARRPRAVQPATAPANDRDPVLVDAAGPMAPCPRCGCGRVVANQRVPFWRPARPLELLDLRSRARGCLARRLRGAATGWIRRHSGQFILCHPAATKPRAQSSECSESIHCCSIGKRRCTLKPARFVGCSTCGSLS